jgi:16S rRNA (cytosine967-C5)-methyltransferase
MAALDALLRLQAKRYRIHLDDVLEDVSRQCGLANRDQRLTHELIAGALRNTTLLEWHLDRVSARPVHALEPAVRWILVMAAYQLLFLDRVGRHAAVHQAVELCKHHAPRATAFVNAVLRALLRQDEAADKDATAQPQDPSVLFSHPPWIVAMYQARYADHCHAILAWNNARRQHYARIRRNHAAVRAELGDAIEASAAFGDNFVRIHDTMAVVNSQAFARGDLYVMQPWSDRVAHAVPLRPGDRVLDMCAAPGGKTIAMVDRAAVVVDALEVDAQRARSLQANLQRCGVTSVTVRMMDATMAADNVGAAAHDVVLLDAPCGNLGVLQRHPEVRWRVQAEDILELAAAQARLLRAAARCVRPGGHLLYAVCTVSPQETNAQMQAFLQRHPAFVLLHEEDSYPGQHDTDGGYWALLQRRE